MAANRNADGIQYAAIQLAKAEEPRLEMKPGSRGLAQHARQLLKQVQMGRNEKKSYVHAKNLYSLSTDQDGTRFLVVTPEDYPRLTSFECLDQMKRVYGTYQASDRLEEEIGRVVTKYSDPSANKVASVKAQVEETKKVMIDNIDRVIERGERINDVVSETDRLANEANAFQTNARTLKRVMWKKKLLFVGLGIVILLIIIFIVVLLACREPNDGVFNWDKCKAK
jgi:vesicle-associated membrane protein 7